MAKASPSKRRASSTTTGAEWGSELEERHAQLLRLVVEAAPNGLVMTDGVGRIVLVNAQVERLFGYERKELLGQPVELLVPQHLRPGHAGQRAQYMSAPLTRSLGTGREVCGRHKDGTEFPIELALNPVDADSFEDAPGPLILSTIVDLSERRRLEERFRLAVEAAPNGMIMTGTDGRIVLLNALAERMFGYRRSEILGHPIEMLIPDRFRGHHTRLRAGFVAAASTRPMGVGHELFARRKDGIEFPVEIGLTPITAAEGLLVLNSVVDVTEQRSLQELERRQADSDRQATEALARSALLAAMSHEIRTPLTGIIGCIDLLEATVDDGVGGGGLSGASSSDGASSLTKGPAMTTPGDRAQTSPAHSEPLARLSTGAAAAAAVVVAAAGTADAVSDGHGSSTASHMQSTSAHVGVSDAAMATGHPHVHSAESLVRTIRHCSDALLNIINDILDFSKLDAGAVLIEHTQFSPGRVVEDVILMLSSHWRAKGIAVGMDVAADVPSVVAGDPSRLRQVLLNLLGNAIKFTEQGGVHVDVAWLPATSQLAFAVRDTGIGIAPEVQGRLFHPFVQAEFSTARVFGGTGLGLVICRKLVELMQGSISLESTLGVGSTLRFVITVEAVAISGAVDARPMESTGSSTGEAPLLTPVAMAVPPASALPLTASRAGFGRPSPLEAAATGPALVPRTRSRAISAPAQRRLTLPKADAALADLARYSVLLVEDDVIVRTVVMAMLHRIGCRSQSADNGADALERFGPGVPAVGPPIDLVLMDCQMPVLDGLSASAELRRCGVRVPIVAMTANTMAGDRERCFAAGMDDFLAKPVRLNDLRACLQRWSAVNAPSAAEE